MPIMLAILDEGHTPAPSPLARQPTPTAITRRNPAHTTAGSATEGSDMYLVASCVPPLVNAHISYSV
jgi:hypothetical protein